MIMIYQLNLLIKGKPVQFTMNVDESLKVKNKIDNKTADEWKTMLKTIAENMFIEEKNGNTT